jgi:hypothetical protein
MAARGRSGADAVLVAALAGGATIAEAAKRAHVAERTVYRRLAEPAFRQQVAEARSRMVSEAVGALALAAHAAVGVLIQLMQSSVPPATRLNAAKAILELGRQLRESEEFEQRLTALEAAQQSAQQIGGPYPWAA